jgi:hypothetical protein
MVVALLRCEPKNLVEFRNKLAVCTLTIGCMRPCEGARATTCCLIFNADFQKELLMDCSTLTTVNRKQDQEQKGHWMRFGKSNDPELNINHQLGLFLDMTGTRPRTNCQGVALQGRKCLTCRPLFPMRTQRHVDPTLLTGAAPSSYHRHGGHRPPWRRAKARNGRGVMLVSER